MTMELLTVCVGNVGSTRTNHHVRVSRLVHGTWYIVFLLLILCCQIPAYSSVTTYARVVPGIIFG